VSSELNPDESRRQAHEDFVRRASLVRRREQLDAAAAEAFDAFRRAGIDAILLKGAALVEALYRPGEPRGYFDVDVLVSPAQRIAAGEVLSTLGYENFSEVLGIDDVAGVLHAELWLRRGFVGPLMIDLHWRLDGCEAPAALVWQALSSDRGWVEVASTTVPTLGLPGLALSVGLHVAQHGPGDGKAVGDLGRALERWPLEVWREAASLATEVGGGEAFAAGLRLLPRGAKLADRLGLGSAERTLWAIANRDSRPRGTFHLDALAEARSAREKVDIIRRALLPSRAWLSWEMRWATRSHAHLALAYLMHIVRAPLWAVRALRYGRRRPLTDGDSERRTP
jgi:hypothetical protein